MSEITEIWDCAIVGGGPAGLTAALHLAWHRRRVIVLDRVSGPLFFTLEPLWNVPGFSGETGAAIQKKLKAQAIAMGAVVERANVVKAEGRVEDFRLTTENGRVIEARNLLLATGVIRHHPLVDGDFEPCFAYAGKGNLFYCPDCEAPETFGKDVLVIPAGTAAAASGTALGLSRYARRVRLLLEPQAELAEAHTEALGRRDIEIVRGAIKALDGDKRHLKALVLDDGTRLESETFFVASPTFGRVDLAAQLGVEITADGRHAKPASQRGDTNVPGVWIAGDLRPMSQQVSVAFGTGNIAAIMIDQHLRKGDIGRQEATVHQR